MSLSRTLLLSLIALTLASSSGCGYTFKRGTNVLLESEKIRKIHVTGFRNGTFVGGAESVVYNSILKMLKSRSVFKIVQDEEDADATFTGVISAADYVPLNLSDANRSGLPVATTFRARLVANFTLSRIKKKDVSKRLWRQTFTRTKIFNAANNTGVQGSTNATINDSEFDRALQDLAREMGSEVLESMLEMF